MHTQKFRFLLYICGFLNRVIMDTLKNKKPGTSVLRRSPIMVKAASIFSGSWAIRVNSCAFSSVAISAPCAAASTISASPSVMVSIGSCPVSVRTSVPATKHTPPFRPV